jgi:hypothetical protein
MNNKLKLKNFDEYLNENLESDILETNKLTDDYKSLKKGIIELLDNTVEDSDKLLNVQNYMDSYINSEDEILEGFIETSDIYDFYLKYQNDIDELLTDEEFFDEYPTEYNIYSLYDYLIEGTKKSVKICMEKMYNELFED